MAIRTVVTRGYGNGTFNGTIPLVVTRGYLGAVAVVAAVSRPVRLGRQPGLLHVPKLMDRGL